MFVNDLQSVFAKVGLDPKEAKIYTACLQNPRGLHVQEIVTSTNINWSTTKVVLERLIAKSFITSYLQENRKVYIAESPQNIVFNIHETADEFKSIIPLFMSPQFGGKHSKVRFFEGKVQVENIFRDILLAMKISKNSEKEILAISSGKDILSVLPNHKKQFIDKRVKEKIAIRWIAPESEVSRGFFATSERELRKMKFFDPKKYPFHNEIDIYGNSIALISLDTKQSGVIIENERLADSHRSLFNLLWDSI